jgi:hypothetical protein
VSAVSFLGELRGLSRYCALWPTRTGQLDVLLVGSLNQLPDQRRQLQHAGCCKLCCTSMMFVVMRELPAPTAEDPEGHTVHLA